MKQYTDITNNKHNTRLKALLLCLLALFWPYAVNAAGPQWQFRGFGTIAATTTSEDIAEFRVEMTQFEGLSDDIDFGLRSKLGLQLNANFNSQFSAVGQVLAKKRGDSDMDPEIEWLYASYQPNRYADFRIGRLVLPFFMLSDSRGVGYVQPFVEPPQTVYIDASVSRFDGIQMLNRFELGEGTLTIQTSLGNSSEEIVLGNPLIPALDVDIKDIVSINFVYDWDNWSLRLGKITSDLDFPDITLNVPTPNPFPPPAVITVPVPLSSQLPDIDDDYTGLGIQYDDGQLVFMAEHTSRDTDFVKSDGYYALIGWRFGKWLPSITMAERDTEDSPVNETTAFTLRHNLSSSMALKFQWESVTPDSTVWLNASPAFAAGEDQDVYTISFDFVF